MHLRVLLFGPAAAAAGSAEVRVPAPSGATAGAVLHALAESHPALRPYVAAGRLAVNHAFAAPDYTVQPTDEVALIAMVSGG